MGGCSTADVLIVAILFGLPCLPAIIRALKGQSRKDD